MGLDIAVNEFVRQKDVAADLINAFLFEGKCIVKKEDIETEESVSAYKTFGGRTCKVVRDCAKLVQNERIGKLYVFFENQKAVSRAMPVRSAGYSYTAYREQVRAWQDKNAAEGNSAFAEELHRDQKLIPVAVIVLYWGTEPWEEPSSMRDLFEISAVNAEGV